MTTPTHGVLAASFVAGSGLASAAASAASSASALAPASGPASAPAISGKRLTAAAEQFEASLMKELVAPLESGAPGGEDDGDAESGDGSEGALAEFARESLARSLAAQGGLGIARTVLEYFQARGKR